MKDQQFNTMEYTRLTTASAQECQQINSLLAQLSSSGKTISEPALSSLLKDDHTQIIVCKDAGKIIGMGSVVVINIPTGLTARIEDVVVDEVYRGKGVGRQLMLELINCAQSQGALSIELTSRPQREAANALYQKLGFQRKDTNVYRMKL